MSSLQPYIDRMEAAHARLAATRAAVVAGAPWPATATEAGAAEEVWGPGEILAHLSEAMRFWLGEVERLLAGANGHGGGEAQVGRTPGDPIRELSVKRDATLPPAELYDRIASEVERYRRRLPELTEADIARVGRHPVRGPMSVADIVDRLVAGHLEDHAAQMERAIGG